MVNPYKSIFSVQTLKVNIHPEVGSFTQPTIHSDIHSGIHSGIQPDIQPRIQPDIQPGIQPDIQPGIQPRIQQEIQPDIQTGSQHNIQPGIQPGIQPIIHPDIHSDIHSNIHSDIQPEIQTETSPYFKHHFNNIPIQTHTGKISEYTSSTNIDYEVNETYSDHVFKEISKTQVELDQFNLQKYNEIVQNETKKSEFGESQKESNHTQLDEQSNHKNYSDIRNWLTSKEGFGEVSGVEESFPDNENLNEEYFKSGTTFPSFASFWGPFKTYCDSKWITPTTLVSRKNKNDKESPTIDLEKIPLQPSYYYLLSLWSSKERTNKYGPGQPIYNKNRVYISVYNPISEKNKRVQSYKF